MRRRRRNGFRAWQGLIAGTLIGIALWRGSTLLDGWDKTDVRMGVSLGQFSRAVANLGAPARPSDLVIHPALDGRALITGQTVDRRGQPTPFELSTPLPIILTTSIGTVPAGRSFDSAEAFVEAVAPGIGYRRAWWEAAQVRAGVLIGVPIIVLGLFLPLAMALLVRAGLIAPPPVPEPEPEPAPADSPSDVADAGAASSQPEMVAATAAANAEEPLPHREPHEPTTYEGGVYYPVHRPKPGEHRE